MNDQNQSRADALTARTETLDERIAREGAMHVNLTIAQLYNAIERVLSHYRLSNWMNEHDGALGLVDRLCDHDARSIESGQHEIRLIVDEIYNEVLMPAAFAASPVEQPAAAPIENAELASMTRMFHAARHDLGLINEALGLDPEDGGAAPILEAIEELKAGNPPPSPADERPAFLSDDEYCDLQAAVQALELIASGLTYAKDHDLDGTMQKATIRDAMRHAKNALRRFNPVYHKLADTWQEARAASANETGAEGAAQFEHIDVQNHTLRRALQRVMARLTSLLDEDQFADIESIVKGAGVEPPTLAAEAVAIPAGYALVPIERSYVMRAKALIAFNTTEQAGKDRDDALDAAYRAELAAVPQPAQADAREGLTDIQLAKVRLGLTAAKHFIANGIELGFIRMPDADCPDPAHDTPKLIDDALALLAAHPGQPEPRDEVTGWQPIDTAPKDGTAIIIARIEDDTVFDVCNGHFEVVDEDEDDGPWDIRDGEPWCSYVGREAGTYFSSWLPGKEWESKWKVTKTFEYTHWIARPEAPTDAARALLAPLPDPAQVVAESPDWIKSALPPEDA